MSFTVSVLMAIFLGELGLAGFIGAKDDGNGGDKWNYISRQRSSQIVTTNKPTPNFLQAGCPSCHPINNVKALKGNYTDLLKHTITADSDLDVDSTSMLKNLL